MHRPFRMPGYPLTPILFVLAAAAIVINTLVTQPRNVIFAIGLMVLGVPAYYMWRSRLAKAPADALASPECEGARDDLPKVSLSGGRRV